MPNRIKQQLGKHYLFSILDDDQFIQILSGVQRLELTENEHVFHFGDVARYFYLLDDGQIQLYRLSPMGEEKVIEIIQPGQSFAEAVMFFKINSYPVSAKAVLNSQLWRIDMKQFLSLLQESNELCLRMLGGMSKRLHAAIQDIEQLTLQNASMRVIQLLLQAAPEGIGNQYSLDLETPKQVLASRLSVRPETFSRILQQLSRKELISVQGKTILILDFKSLQKELNFVQ
ncbi:Crp/Fnr family transcriptional regulator [Methylomarinum sp. Ch1-1]|uniref:Crp/Fnr family transcriptional regulator n=1 Tax=Methylomarinum roseum TaxID=3067653 RepID=A0AAU7NQV4_9GAMM|nr:Crp/Fnr family transcriptional regulator [Methylomarinum sp. Ch1-1]MDP4520700.1 Crp/Fnr family transcriptional regulator [Methylomarinum sp. Ch1-1]